MRKLLLALVLLVPVLSAPSYEAQDSVYFSAHWLLTDGDGTDDRTVSFSAPFALEITHVSCRNDTSTPTTMGTFRPETADGGIIGNQVTCVNPGANVTWTAISTADADRLVAEGEGLRWDNGTASNPTTDDYTVSVKFRKQ